MYILTPAVEAQEWAGGRTHTWSFISEKLSDKSSSWVFQTDCRRIIAPPPPQILGRRPVAQPLAQITLQNRNVSPGRQVWVPRL